MKRVSFLLQIKNLQCDRAKTSSISPALCFMKQQRSKLWEKAPFGLTRQTNPSPREMVIIGLKSIIHCQKYRNFT